MNAWPEVGLHYLVRFGNGQDYMDVEDPDGDVPVIGSGGPFAAARTHLYDGESVLFGRKGTIDKPRYQNGRFWTVDTIFYTVLGPRVHGKWLYYWATTVPYELYSTSTALPSMTSAVLGRLRVPLPSLDEQVTIADYLDRATAQIDELIEKQTALLCRLRERNSSVIAGAVWRGLEGAARRSTGIDTAPDAPAHWRRLRNKHLWRESIALSADGSEEPLSVSHITGVTPRSEKNVTMIEAESYVGYRIVRPNDLVVNTMWAWMGALGVSSHGGVVSPAYGVYRLKDGVEADPHYLDALYRTTAYVSHITRYSTGVWSSRLRLYPDVFLRLPVVLPPLEEQRRISEHIQEQSVKVHELIAKTERFIELTRERRSALITAAVTEQIDVATKGAA